MKNYGLGIFQKMDWQIRTAVAGCTVTILIITVIFGASYLSAAGISSASERKIAIVLGDWLASISARALAEGGFKSLSIDDVIKHPDVKDAAIFDRGGRVIAPLSRRGERAADMNTFEEILLEGYQVIRTDDGGAVELFRPIPDYRDAIGGSIGLAYVAVSRRRESGFWGAVPAALFALISISLFVFWIIRVTRRAIDCRFKNLAGGRFDYLKDRVEDDRRDIKKETAGIFAVFLRRFVHMIPLPAFLLDGRCRLKEINEAGVRMFGGSKCASEGAHVADLLKGSNLKEEIIDILGKVDASVDVILNSEKGSASVSVFPSREELSCFKYAVICGKEIRNL